MISGLLNTILTCVLNIYLLLFLKQGLNGYLIANVVGIGVAIVYQLIFGRLIQDIHLFKFKSHFKPMSEYSVPLIINSVAWWINSASDRYILTFIRGVSANGLYSVSYKIPTILSTVQTVFYNAWSIAAVTEFDADDHDGFIGKTYTMYSVVSILACSLIMLLNIPLAKMLYSKDFFLAWKYVPFILVGTVFNGIAVFQGCLFAAVKKTKAVSRSTTVGAVVNIGCTVIFVYYFGAMGAAFATLVGYLVTWIFRSIQLNEIIHMKVDWTRHYLSCLILVVQSFVAIRRGTFFVQLIMILVLAFISGKYMVSILQKVLNAFIERIRKN
ncbi:MOP superfamily multidrug oligosaccharidyl-lipid polysaccharide flippase transporter [Lacticaseibacillus paracasei subsp. paracasei ATCC 25302 = DSM 5622 = JCM 8130]|nr:MOP superfamily multidrug oligosaccharidyl-lipid polysaccharide flippase transporter [Lacticaseibacillus paracasei subsp. paracasei ATCC 25302 = DSM 5622 = JCM 8130]